MSQRSNQVAEELRKIISLILLEDLNDPQIGFVTITRIDLTEDLRFARIYYSVLGSDDQKKLTEQVLVDNMGFIKKLAIERINMKYAIELRFEPDRSLEHGLNIDQILDQIKKQREEKGKD
jgi:ribosome-binding factor A